ncbi:MAG: hypothetical protein J5I91_04265 [Bacteroidetes bacterium]|nr:hypothetical protein [Bacteroidota bacterium]
MFSGTIITGLIIVLVCIIPIILMFLNSRIKKRKIITLLNSLAKQENKEISQFDVWKSNAIGIDQNHSHIFAIRKMSDGLLQYSINLNEVKSCKLINRNKTTSFEGGSTTMIEQLSLQFFFKEGIKPEQVIDFYHIGFDTYALADELQLTQKWEKLIVGKLN